MKNKLLSRKSMIKMIYKTKGKVFRVSFIKRTTGERRDLVGRLGVAKDIVGTGMKYDAPDRALTVVYDFQKKAYRMINLETVFELKFRDRIYKLKE